MPFSANVMRDPSSVNVSTLSDGADTTDRGSPPELGIHSTNPRLRVFRLRVAAGSSRMYAILLPSGDQTGFA